MAASIVSSAAERAIRRTRHHEADVVVVGAGVAGCAVAFALAEQGRSVLLLERWLRKPDRIVGELLQPGGVASLRRLGLGHCLDGIDAVPCFGYDVVYHGEELLLHYPRLDDDGGLVYSRRRGGRGKGGRTVDDDDDDNGDAKAAAQQRPQGRSFHHGNFIQKLRDSCSGHPNISVVETEVTSTIRGTHGPEVLGVQAKTLNRATGLKEPDCFFGQLTVICDGYDSRFRKQYAGADAVPQVRSKFYALELVSEPGTSGPLPHPGFGHVIISDSGAAPVLLYQIGSRETRALIDVPVGLPAAGPAKGGVRGYMRDVVAPGLPPSVRPAFERALDAQHGIPRSMPNSWLPPRQQGGKGWTPGVLLLGDAMNMRHPLTGGGMTVALNDVVVLADLLGGGGGGKPVSLSDQRAVAAALRSFHWRRKRLTAIINVLAQALYALFAAQDRLLACLQRGCIEYFRRGHVDAPMGLLGGVVPRPLVLASHFFAVAFVGIWIHTLDLVSGRAGILMLPVAAVDAVLILWKACVVFLPTMWRELI